MRRFIFLPVATLLLVNSVIYSQEKGYSLVKLQDFQLQSSSVINEDGDELSLTAYKSKTYWFPVRVPSTVLSGLVSNGVYPDPNYGLNNMLIPDASDEFNKKYELEKYSYLPNDPNPWKKPYWYRTEFAVPSQDRGRHFQLIFKGINYRAAVWVNGKLIADSTKMAGMFAEYSLDVSDAIVPGSLNALAVKIYPLDYPGLPSTEQLEVLGDFYPNGGPTGDIGKNVTMLCSVGWDWVPPVRDRNIGIWLPVYLKTSGGVTFKNTKITTSLPALPDTSLAELSLSLTLKNHSSSASDGALNISISPYNFKGKAIRLQKTISLGSGAGKEVELNAQNTKELRMTGPTLWWPNGHGRPALYKLNLQYVSGGQVLNDTTLLFGVRSVSTKAVNVNGQWRRDFYVNGRRIQLVGGAWVPDFMLNRDSLRYDYEMRLCRNANVNLVRIWGGGVTPCDEFFDAADRYGMLVWSDFWITGDTQGEFKGSPDWPLEGEVFKRNVVSTILRIRNHPSLLVWTGGNEGHARRELYDFMRNSIIELDGTRPFIPSSSGFARLPEGWPMAWPDNLPTGVYSGGPYTWQDPKSYYTRVLAARDWLFKDETGIPSMVPYNILPKVIPNLVWDKTKPFPLNNTWGYHDAATGNGRWNQYYNETIRRFGEAVTMEDFANKMQLMNAMGYQGIFEAAGHKLNDVGGVMLWKLNAAFPSVVWQVYDWFLMPNAGYYFMQNAIEPVHIQLNLVNNMVTVLNRTYKPVEGLIASAEILDLNSKSVFKTQQTLDLKATDVRETISLSDAISREQGVLFVVLNLKNSAGKVISRNIYWLSGNQDYKALDEMPEARVTISVSKTLKTGSDYRWTLMASNHSDKLAFFLRPQLMSGGEEVLPSFWSGSYFSLAPGESRELTVMCPVTALNGNKASIKISGWNVRDQEVIPSKN
jgi:exo-1,4-beta-D-glucosaminidase